MQGLCSHGMMGVRSIRYRSAAVPAVAEIVAAIAPHVSEMSMARGTAAMPPTPADVIEATRNADPAVVEAWLAEEGEGFPLSGTQLEALADSGVPGDAIDVMVAMTYPKVFTVAAPSARGGFNAAQAARRTPTPDTMVAYPHPYDGYGRYAPPGPWGWDYYSPWSWSLYGYYSPFFYGPYGQFSPYGYVGYGGYGGYYYGGGTIVVVGNGSGNPPPPHGRIVNGKGYDYGGTSGSQPTTRGASGSSSSGSSAAPPPRSSGSSSQVGQHAHPKP